MGSPPILPQKVEFLNGQLSNKNIRIPIKKKFGWDKRGNRLQYGSETSDMTFSECLKVTLQNGTRVEGQVSADSVAWTPIDASRIFNITVVCFRHFIKAAIMSLLSYFHLFIFRHTPLLDILVVHLLLSTVNRYF